jgi:hypothetical protein
MESINQLTDHDDYNDFEYWKSLPSSFIINDDEEEEEEEGDEEDEDDEKNIIDFLYYKNKFKLNKEIIINDFDDNYFNNNDKMSLNSPNSLSYVSIDCNFDKEQYEGDRINSNNQMNNNLIITTTPTISNNIITSTRFLHLNNTLLTSNKKSNNVNNDDLLLNKESPQSQNLVIPTTIKLENLITLTPATTQLPNSITETPTNSDSGVVSRIKNWIGIRKNTPKTTTQATSNDLSSEASSSSSSFKLTKLFLQQTSVDPSNIENLQNSSSTSLSTNISNKTPSELYYLTNNNLDSIIDKKLKRPSNVPNTIDYNNAQEFQGSLLEEWLLQSFDDYIINYINQFKIVNQLAASSSSSIGTINSNELKEKPEDLQQLMIQSINDYDLKKQEISYIIEQILTNLLACGVLEFANGFENAINKIFKVSKLSKTNFN